MNASPSPAPKSDPTAAPPARGAQSDRLPPRTAVRRAFYRVCRAILLGVMRVVYRIRVRGVENVPRRGPLLVVANHQSHLDPPAIGVGLPRTDLSYLAREGLFRVPVLSWVISALNAIPLDEKRGDIAAIRTAVAALRDGRAVALFPEGTRSPDGALQPFKRGAWLLMSRAGCDVLPVAIEGAFDAWPRKRKRPRLRGQRLAVAYGVPIAHEALAALGPEGALAHLSGVIDSMRLELRRELREATRGRFPATGPGDTGVQRGAAGPARA